MFQCGSVRRFVPVLLVVCLAASLPVASAEKPKMIVLGIDGMDPRLLQRFMDEGLLPNIQRLVEQGDFKPLQTTMPPLSPIAWSTFITGMDPGGHGIYDFIHRDPETYFPKFAMTETVAPESCCTSRWPPRIGNWCIPKAGEINNLRQGTAFWEILEKNGVPTTVFRMPANYPPVDTRGRAFSGMGTPDITGSPGTFSFYTTNPPPNHRDMSGGKVYPVRLRNNVVEARLFGPENAFLCEEKPRRPGRDVEYRHPKLEIDFTVFLDPEAPAAKIVAQDQELILREGEWSDWIRVDFEALPWLVSVSATARFYLKQARPDFELYVTPLQINPEEPALPISDPGGWSHELWEELGYFYTQELPADTKALSGGVFTGPEFWTQTQSVYAERRRALDHFLDNFEKGFLFFYFTSVDQGCHMLWRYVDREHPGFEDEPSLAASIKTLYLQMDEAIGHVMERLDDDTTLVVMSDHGFSPFNWGVNLNTWLLENGHVTLRNPSQQGRHPVFGNVDWSRTRAYAVGLNGLYVNLRGRERDGIVNPGAEYTRLLDQLEQDLLELRDPRNGQQAVTLVVRPRRDFHGEHLDAETRKRIESITPDIIVGYNRGYRSSWESPLGEFPKQIFVDNPEAWSGDHAMDYRHVPGVLITNRKITLEEPALYDLTVAILDEYGIPKPEQMKGTDCLGPAPAAPVSAARKEVSRAEPPTGG